MNYLFFDTETTGFARFNLPDNHHDQPHLVQVAAKLCDSDRKEISSISTLVELPGGIKVPEGAYKVHGIDAEKANTYGIHYGTISDILSKMFFNANVIVAHNISFDQKVIQALFARLMRSNPFEGKDLECTMDRSLNIVNIPPTPKMVAAGRNGPKPPKLEECIRHFFNEDLEGAHDAMVDVNACQRVFYHLIDQGHIGL